MMMIGYTPLPPAGQISLVSFKETENNNANTFMDSQMWDVWFKSPKESEKKWRLFNIHFSLL